MRLGRHAIPLTFATLCVVGGLYAGTLLADAATPAAIDKTAASTASASLQSVDGKVVSTSASSLVIQTDAGNRLTFNLDSTTAEPASLAAGDRVSVRYSTPAGGGNHADAVTLAAAPPSATADTSTRTTTATTTAATPAPESSATTATPASGLPKTASRLPLILLVGTLAALVAYGIHLSRERI